jgi:hypothetical protein
MLTFSVLNDLPVDCFRGRRHLRMCLLPDDRCNELLNAMFNSLSLSLNKLYRLSNAKRTRVQLTGSRKRCCGNRMARAENYCYSFSEACYCDDDGTKEAEVQIEIVRKSENGT